jgi:hypothetical protein
MSIEVLEPYVSAVEDFSVMDQTLLSGIILLCKLSALARNYGDVFWDHAASAIDGCCPWIFASTASRSARVNFHSKGRAILS